MKQQHLRNLFLIAISLIVLTNIGFAKNTFPEIDIPFKKFKLDNGLTVIIHEDHKAPIIATNIWYHVGSKNEKFGKTGFAHLFEHLMFNGSENYNKDYFQAMDRIGATRLNGTTNSDRTNYFQSFPVSALDQVLFLESDRMGHLVGAIDQAKLDEQRGVVQNEKRQGENEPYSISEELITKATFPAGHPYSWTTIGSMEDLNAASLADVKEWFKTYYGPSNAVLCIAGDISTDLALEKAKQYFGDINPGPPVPHFNQWVAKRTGIQRETALDRVPQTKITMVWNVPGTGVKETDYLDLASMVLGSGKTSRLYKRLVYKDQLATRVSVYNNSSEIAGQFVIEVDVKADADPMKVENIINEELNNFLKTGPTEDEMERAKTRIYSSFVNGLESIGGFGGKSDILAMFEVFTGSPDGYKEGLHNTLNATASDVQKAAKEWLSDGVYILQINPFPDYKQADKGIDRKVIPEVVGIPDVHFPKFQKATLSNGMKLIICERKTIPSLTMDLEFEGGYSSDKNGIPGTASLAMNMLDEGTKTLSSIEISEKLNDIGASIWTGASLDHSNVGLQTLKNKLDDALKIWSDVILNPAFAEKELDRLKKLQAANIKNEKNSPFTMALRILPKYLYGASHPYSMPMTGSGTEKDVSKITTSDCEKFYKNTIMPNNATLIITGDITLDEIKPKLEALFANWKKGETHKTTIKEVDSYFDETIYIMDKKGAQQSTIFASHLMPPKMNPDEFAIQSMNDIFGGIFTSRINMNLREDKHWSYGCGSFIPSTKSQRPYIVYAPVQTDKTKESIMEMRKELNNYVSTQTATKEEVAKNQRNKALQLTGYWESNFSVLGSLSDMVKNNYPDDYFDKLKNRYEEVSQDKVESVAKKYIKPEKMVWVVVGDREKIEAGIKEIGFKKIKYIDTDGNEIE